jgi:general stress protein YciG
MSMVMSEDQNRDCGLPEPRLGKGWHGNSEGHAAAGRIGGKSHSREHMAELGRKGGAVVARNKQHMVEIGRKGGLSKARNKNNATD